MFAKLLLIAFGGAVGSVGRYLLARLVQGPRMTGDAAFPLGTLSVNLLGSLLIGILAVTLMPPSRYQLDEKYRVAIFIGLLGGFTTFSTFSFETFELFRQGFWGRAALNVVLTNVLCLVGVWVGYRGASMLAAD